jgi:hypothetical protein
MSKLDRKIVYCGGAEAQRKRRGKLKSRKAGVLFLKFSALSLRLCAFAVKSILFPARLA